MPENSEQPNTEKFSFFDGVVGVLVLLTIFMWVRYFFFVELDSKHDLKAIAIVSTSLAVLLIIAQIAFRHMTSTRNIRGVIKIFGLILVLTLGVLIGISISVLIVLYSMYDQSPKDIYPFLLDFVGYIQSGRLLHDIKEFSITIILIIIGVPAMLICLKGVFFSGVKSISTPQKMSDVDAVWEKEQQERRDGLR